MKLVYICSPYKGDIAANITKARCYSKYALCRGVIPIAPHLLFPQFIEDRGQALELDLALLEKCDEIWVFGNTMSAGMIGEINAAREKNIPIKHIKEEV